MARQAKRLIDHVVDRTFRPSTHQRLLVGEDLPLNPIHPAPTPAMTRLWARLRALQSEHRDVSSVEVRHDLATQFGRTAREYMDAVGYSRMNPLDDIAGLRGAWETVERGRQAYLHELEQKKAEGTD
jgi:hypothetical protein